MKDVERTKEHLIEELEQLRRQVTQLSASEAERKRIEEELRLSEAKYQALVENANEIIVVIQDNMSKYSNPKAVEITGYSKEELTSRPFLEFVHPDDYQVAIDNYSMRLKGDWSTPGKPVRIVCKDGSVRWVEFSDSQFSWEGKPAVMYLVNDVTEWKQMEKALGESEAKYRELAESITDVFFALDDDLRYTYWNKASEELTGISAKDALGKRLYDVFTDNEATKRAEETYRRTLATGRPQHFISNFPIGDRDFVFEINTYPTTNGLCVYVRDITEQKKLEEALEESEQWYRLIFDNTPFGIGFASIDGKVITHNKAMEAITGYTAEEFARINLIDMYIDKADRDVFLQELRQHGSVTGYSVLLKRKDGTQYDALMTSKLVTIEDKEFVQTICHDVTERKRAEEALRESEERYRFLVELSPEAIFVASGGKHVFTNSAGLKLLGASNPDQIIGKPVGDVIHPDFREIVADRMRKAMETGMTPPAVEERFLRLDGTEIDVEVRAAPLIYQGRRAMQAVVRDISERKKAEEALRASEARYRLLAENVRDVIWATDMDLRFTYVSPSVKYLGDRTAEEIMSMSLDQLLSPSSQELAKKVFAEELTMTDIAAQDATRSRTVEVEFVRRDGSILWAELKMNFMRDLDGRPVGILGVMRDISERKKAEEERRALEQKAQLASRLASVGELASGVAHEINNPLTGVIGYAELLMQEDVPERIKHDLETIHDGAKRVADIVKGLLKFARQTKPERTLVNINEIIKVTLRLRSYELETSNIRVTTKLAPDLPLTVADAGQLQQVFLNLLINAEMEMRLAHGKGKLLIKTEHVDNRIRISFKDDGPGIAKKNLERIFEPFFSTRGVGKGTGLGLSICHGIVTEHGGKIWAESQLGNGASFIVELPIITEEKRLKHLKTARKLRKAIKGKILVVDDEPVVRQLLSQILTEEGHEVETTDNGKDALNRIKNNGYSLIMVDIKLPGMSGNELYERIQIMARPLAQRVVLITGDVMSVDTEAFIIKTKVPCITKPFDVKQLKAEINRLLAIPRSKPTHTAKNKRPKIKN
jgi:PAS domain S-box-containing protein